MGWKKETVLKSIAANKVTYDNSGSPLLSDNVQDAIDELAAWHIVDAGFKDYPGWQDFTFSTGVTEVTLTQDENADTPEPIVDTNKVVSDPTNFSVIHPVTKKAVFKEGSFLAIESNRVKVISYNPLTGTVTLNFVPKSDYRITYLIEYLNTQVPNGKQISAENGEVIISNVDEAIEIQFDNTLNGFDAEEVQSAIIEAYTKTRYTNYGVVKQPTTHKNIDGTVTIDGDGEFIFQTETNGTGINVKLNVPQAILTPPADTISYLYADYNSGSPFFAFTTTAITFRNNATLLPVIRVIKETGFDPHFEEYDEYAVQLPNKMLYKDIILRNFERLNGLLLTMEGIRKSKVAAGVASFGVQFFNLAENLAGTSGLLIEYYLTGGVWNRATVTEYDSSYYSDGTNRQNLGNSKWVAKYFWRDVGSDNEVYYIHGNQYNSEVDAKNEKVPAAPPLMSAHSIYVGRIVIEQGATAGTAVPRDWEAAIQSATVTVHNGLSEIQGGTSTERYHLTASEHSSVSGLSTPIKALLADRKINGIAEAEKSKYTATYDPATRVLTMNLSADSYYYVDGVRYAISAGNYTFTAHANATGTYFYYFDSTGIKQVSATAWDILSTAQLFYVYFNATTQYYEIGYELHGVVMDSATHRRMHLADGTKFVSGGALGDYTIKTDTLAAVQFSIASAVYHDEDIPLVSDTFADGSNYRILSRNNSGEWALTVSPLPYLNTLGGTNNPVYNQSGTALTEITTNDRYFNSYVVLTNFIGAGRKTVIIPGQTLYTTLIDAQSESIANLNLGGLPFQEFVILHKVTFRYRNTYSTTTAKTRIEADPIQITVNSATISGFAGSHSALSGSHSALSGREDFNSHPISAINATIANAIIFEKADGTGLSESSDFTWNDTTKTLSAKNITTEKLNGLTLTKQTNGFTIAGGTTSTTLTVANDANVSGSNTGDQTSIEGITGTITQFNTALTDGDFATLDGSEVLTNKTLTSPVINTTATGTGVTTSGIALKVVKTDRLGDIYERGFRVAEDFKTQISAPSLYFNGTNSSGVIANDDNLSFTDNTNDRPFSQLFFLENINPSSTVTYFLGAKRGTDNFEWVSHIAGYKLYFTTYSLTGTKYVTYSTSLFQTNFTGTIGIVYNGNKTANIYINGIQQQVNVRDLDGYTNMEKGTAPYYISYSGTSPSYSPEHSMMYNRIFNRALTQLEIQKYSYGSIDFSDVGASNKILTTGSIKTGKRYKVISSGTGIVVNGETQTAGTELISNSPTVTWNGGTLMQIGCVLDLSSDSIANTGWFDKSGNNLHATYTNALPVNLQNYKPRIQGYSADMRGANVASATTITPTGEIFHVTGTTAIATINVPYSTFDGSITIIPDGIFTWTTAGNIALAGTAVVSKALRMTYDATTSKWYPDYIA